MTDFNPVIFGKLILAVFRATHESAVRFDAGRDTNSRTDSVLEKGYRSASLCWRIDGTIDFEAVAEMLSDAMTQAYVETEERRGQGDQDVTSPEGTSSKFSDDLEVLRTLETELKGRFTNLTPGQSAAIGHWLLKAYWLGEGKPCEEVLATIKNESPKAPHLKLGGQ
jgi:hypothetical protein